MSHGFALPEIRDNEIINEHLRDSAALTVIGRSANSSGDPADIVASNVGDALMYQSGATIGFGTASSFCGPSINRYHPDREPLTGLDTACSDNFLNNAEQLSWRWGNQGTSTLTNEMDSEILSPQLTAANSLRCRWINAPSSVDFCMTGKFAITILANPGGGGIQVLSAGSEATPTAIDRMIIRGASLARMDVQRSSMTSYTSADTMQSEDFVNSGSITGAPISSLYFQFRYVASSKVLTGYYCDDGMTWKLASSRTLANHPSSIGWHANNGSTTVLTQTRIIWFRTFTSGVNSATSAQYTSGQVGS